MRSKLLWSTMTLAALLVAGCGGGSQSASKSQPAETPQADAGSSGGPEASKGMIPAPDAAAATVSLAGTLGCGHCTFHVKDSCTLAMKTEAGEVYLIEAGPQQEALMDKRYDEPAVLVAGRVSEVDGQKILYADSVELR